MAMSGTSCADRLDADKYFNDRLSLEDVFTEKNNTLRWLSNSFSYLSTVDNVEIATHDGTYFNFADDIYFLKNYGNGIFDGYKTFKRGTYNENTRQESWNGCYNGIRQATVFIQNVDMNYNLTEEERKDYKAQARFVRAYYYWLLLKKYGPIVIAPDDGFDYTQTYDELSVPRSSYDECAQYIADEMKLAARDLPTSRGADDIAMPTCGAALAVRAKALLYAASPINNPRPSDEEKFADLKNFDGKNLIAQEYNEEKWAKAAAAALDVINLGVYQLHVAYAKTDSKDGYPATVKPCNDGDFSLNTWPNGYSDIDPYESYRSLFNGDVSGDVNKEIIFSRHQNISADYNMASFARMCMPVNPANGQHCIGVTQKQCDAYYMFDGKDCPGKEWELKIPGRSNMAEPRTEGFVETADLGTPGYEHLVEGVSKEYAKREPRFYASVAYSGCVWPMLSNLDFPEWATQIMKPIFYYRGEDNGYGSGWTYLPTGIGFMKYVNPYDACPTSDTSKILPKTETSLRYADILLCYAEALNELTGEYQINSWDDSEQYTISRSIAELKKGVRPVRCRAGIPDFSNTEYENPDLFRNKIKRERQIEFVGESQRYFDLRRWKDAKYEESLDVYGCNVLMTKENRDLFHRPIVVKDLSSVFSRKMYFWPIPMNELKRNKNLVQNPGWQYND